MAPAAAAAEDRMKWGRIVLPIVYKRMWQRREDTDPDTDTSKISSVGEYCLALQICAASRNHNLIQSSSPNPRIPPVQARELKTLYHKNV